MKHILFIILISCASGQDSEKNESQAAEKRTIDLSVLGIDLDAIFDSLLSPSGIVNQFAISLSLQLFQSVKNIDVKGIRLINQYIQYI